MNNRLPNHELLIRGTFPRVATVAEEWDIDIANPADVMEFMKGHRVAADLFTFMQRLPVSKPQFGFQFEWDNVAAIPVTTYEHWVQKQLHRNPRNKLKKSLKAGLSVRVVPFDDAFARGVKEIQDEVRIRQGRLYAHFKKDLEWTRSAYGTYLERATYIGAFCNDELVGFLKLVPTGAFARTMGLLTKLKYREMAPMNALIAKAVEICSERRFSHLVYGRYDYGKVGSDSVADFKYYNGFEHILLPRYYIPLNKRGRIAMKLKLHHGALAFFPRAWVQKLRDFKVRYYENKYRDEIAAAMKADNPRGVPQPAGS